MTHDLWTNLNKRMFEYLDSVSLQDLVAQQRQPGDITVLHDERQKPRRPGRMEAVA